MTQLFFLFALAAFIFAVGKYLAQDVRYFIDDFEKMLELEDKTTGISKQVDADFKRIEQLELSRKLRRRPLLKGLGSAPKYPEFRS